MLSSEQDSVPDTGQTPEVTAREKPRSQVLVTEVAEPLDQDAIKEMFPGRDMDAGQSNEIESKPAQAVRNRVEPAPGVVIRQYKLIRELGRGGMGSVFLARDTQLGRKVAIKFLTRDKSTLARRFRAEARATARCKHENIVVIHEVAEHESRSYMVLEYIEGPTLRIWLQERCLAAGVDPVSGLAVPPARAVEIMVPVVRALVCAHGLGIVHRDLKPENIILADAGPVKVVDFGIAKLIAQETLTVLTGTSDPFAGGPGLTVPGAMLGTAPYMAPEQLRSESIDHRIDIWAAGIILYELVTGHHPLAPLNQATVMQVGVLGVPMPRLSVEHPELGPIAAIIDRCLLKPVADRTASAQELLDELESLLPDRPVLALGEGKRPFVGLAAYQQSDSDRFVGRDSDIEAALALLEDHALVAVSGPSGAGISSFVRAGVLPALKRTGQAWDAYTIRPGAHPVAALASLLVELDPALTAPRRGSRKGKDGTGTDSAGMVDRLRAQPAYLATRLRERAHKTLRHILLFVDPFADLHAPAVDAGERAAFVSCLLSIVEDPGSPIRIVLALRPDVVDRMTAQAMPGERAPVSEFAEQLTRGLLVLAPMERRGLRDILVKSVENAGYGFESSALVERIVDDLDGSACPLPLLQLALTRLWDARDRNRKLLTRAMYHELGGVAGALAAHADTVLAGLPAADKKLARAIVLNLVTAERSRARAGMNELCERFPDPDDARRVIDYLAGARLVVIKPSTDTSSVVELVHDALVHEWALLADWLDETSSHAQFLARVRSAAEHWEKSGRPQGLLWRDEAAREAAAWLARPGHDPESNDPDGEPGPAFRLSKRDEHYLRAVVDLAGRTQRRRWIMAITVGAVFVILAVVVAVLAVQAKSMSRALREQDARHKAAMNDAQNSLAQWRGQAAHARNATRMAVARALRNDPTMVIALLRELEPVADGHDLELPQDWDTLARDALDQGVARAVLVHDEPVKTAWFGPKGGHVIAVLESKRVKWNADGAGEATILAHPDNNKDDSELARGYSPGGTRKVAALPDGTARLGSADGSGPLIFLRGHQGPVYSARFSPDVSYIVTASADGTARLWKGDGSSQLAVLRGHDGPVRSAAFSPDSTHIVTASDDGSVRVWSVSELIGSAQKSAPGPATSLRPDSARLWTATRYCMPVEQRQHLLGTTGVMARANHQACLTRVMEAATDTAGGQ